MNARLASFGIMMSVCTTAVAQKTATLPLRGIHPGSANVGLSMITPAPKWLPTRQQCLYPSRDLPASPISIREVAFKPRRSPMFFLDSAVVTLTLDMSIGPLLPRKHSRTFAANHGKTITRVFGGKVQLPKILVSTKQDWYFRIPFQRPFLADKKKGPSLVLDFRTSSMATKMQRAWELEQAEKDRGRPLLNGTGWNCHLQKFHLIFQSFSNGIFVGSHWEYYAGPLLPNQQGFLALGDAGLGSKWGGLTLPLDLKSLGAPGCTWAIRPFLFLPFSVGTRGVASLLNLRIPNDKRLANTMLYLHGAYTYPKANALGWLFLPSLAWRIGSGEDTDATSLGANRDSPPSKVAGWRLLTNPVPYLRITY